MDVQKYIDSGVLEAYCMGVLDEEDQAFLIQMSMLYPQVKEALINAELIMEELALLNAKKPNPDIKGKIMVSLGFNDQLDINNLPVIDKNANFAYWLNALKHLMPKEPVEDFTATELTRTDEVQQFLVVTKSDATEETHENSIESFLILKGQCTCIMGDKLVNMEAGDFFEIPLRAKHTVKVSSPYVVAVLQYRFI